MSVASTLLARTDPAAGWAFSAAPGAEDVGHMDSGSNAQLGVNGRSWVFSVLAEMVSSAAADRSAWPVLDRRPRQRH